MGVQGGCISWDIVEAVGPLDRICGQGTWAARFPVLRRLGGATVGTEAGGPNAAGRGAPHAGGTCRPAADPRRAGDRSACSEREEEEEETSRLAGIRGGRGATNILNFKKKKKSQIAIFVEAPK